MLRRYNIPVAGRHAVVVGRSDIVGKPMALLLLHADATVTICHSKTSNLAEECRRADILVAAIGKAHLITRDYMKPGVVIIDVGMNRKADGKLAGDVTDDAKAIASAYTPVPGGVGPLTIAMLMANTVRPRRTAPMLRVASAESRIDRRFGLRQEFRWPRARRSRLLSHRSRQAGTRGDEAGRGSL